VRAGGSTALVLNQAFRLAQRHGRRGYDHQWLIPFPDHRAEQLRPMRDRYGVRCSDVKPQFARGLQPQLIVEKTISYVRAGVFEIRDEVKRVDAGVVRGRGLPG
jgi:hypothetical protein